MAPERTLVIPERFCGPPGTGNGGYVAGRLASLVASDSGSNPTIEVTLRRPIPLGRSLRVEEQAEADGGVVLRLFDANGEAAVLLAEARVATSPDRLPLPPARPARVDAELASRGFVGFRVHPVPRCFVCGTARTEGDGLRIFPGALPKTLSEGGRPEHGAVAVIAAPWTPDVSLAEEDGAAIRPEFVWAALDCPGGFTPRNVEGSLSTGSPMLLGRLTARVTGVVRVGERCSVVAWPLGTEGRKHLAGSAVIGEDGGLRGTALAIWFAPAR